MDLPIDRNEEENRLWNNNSVHDESLSLKKSSSHNNATVTSSTEFTTMTTTAVTSPVRTPLKPVENHHGGIRSHNSAASKRLKQDTDINHGSQTMDMELLSSILSSSEEQSNVVPRVISRDVVQFLYQEAITEKSGNGDQSYLNDAGLLSLEQVLLPAAATAVETFLRNCQKLVQRHFKQQHEEQLAATSKDAWKPVRKLVFTSLPSIQQAIAESRSRRAVVETQREAQWQKERERQSEQRERDMQTAREQRRLERKRELQKKLSANQQLWREIAYLQTQLTKLHHEERMWQNAEQMLQQEQQHVLIQEENANAPSKAEEDDFIKESDPLATQVTQTIQEAMQEVQLSARRIQSALQIVSQTMHKAEQVRQQLYQQYTADHQFYGYPGYHDPKALLRALSQPTQDDDDDTSGW